MKLNYRNHRSWRHRRQIGYTGGMNMGRVHRRWPTRFATWRDTHLR